MAACASSSNRAPVEDRRPASSRPSSSATSVSASTAGPSAAAAGENLQGRQPPGSENAGKPGYYMVKAGDTLIRIGLDTGQNWRDIARWNGLDNPNLIEVGQVLRVTLPAPVAAATQGTAPDALAGAASARPVASAGRVESRPLDGKPPAAGAAGAAAGSGSAAAAGPGASAPPSAAREADEELNWAWPAAGQVVTAFDESKNKGLAITGKAGDPVSAAADGRVVYAGSGLRGYGNLVIIKHNATFLTAYAHNQTLLVKEDQIVRRGQKIAEMGNSEAETVQLHFEVRRQGRPVDPARLLPPRP
jgi:lipoprotein NlpD